MRTVVVDDSAEFLFRARQQQSLRATKTEGGQYDYEISGDHNDGGRTAVA